MLDRTDNLPLENQIRKFDDPKMAVARLRAELTPEQRAEILSDIERERDVEEGGYGVFGVVLHPIKLPGGRAQIFVGLIRILPPPSQHGEDGAKVLWRPFIQAQVWTRDFWRCDEHLTREFLDEDAAKNYLDSLLAISTPRARPTSP